jgi:hypothetical protein
VTFAFTARRVWNAYYSIGTIKYSDVDGPLAPDGLLVYVKPSLSGDEPIDVLNYARRHPSFPNETTLDGQIDEGQSDSYRVLGMHSVDVMAFCRRYSSPDVSRRAGRTSTF